MSEVPEEFVKLITELEGSSRVGYVPRDNSGAIIGNSGVTIGKGLDLGAQSQDSLRQMDIYDDLLERMSPYLGMRGDTAATHAPSLMVNAEEETLINTGVVREYWNKFNNAYEQWVGTSSESLPDKSRYAVASRYFNSGNATFTKGGGRPTNFTTQLKEERWEDAANNLETWFKPGGKYDALIPRVKKEAKLFREGFAEQGRVSDTEFADISTTSLEGGATI